MYSNIARAINLVVAVLISIEILGAALTTVSMSAGNELALYSEESSSSVLGSFLFEKAEEENEKTEEENVHMSRVMLIDFSLIALSLCASHAPDFELSVNTFRFDVRPPVHQLNCVYLL